MKFSIALSAIILAIGAVLGWQDHRRLEEVRKGHARLVAEASEAGIMTDGSGKEDGVRVTKREREDKEADARKTAADFIAFAKEMEEIEKKGGQQDEAVQKRIMSFMDRMMALDASQLKILVQEMREAEDLEDETRRGLIGFSIMTLANDHPQTAITLLMESSTDEDGVTHIDGVGKHALSTALSKWAGDDPMAALEWLKKASPQQSALLDDNAKEGMICGVAANDPKLAFKLISEMGFTDGVDAVGSIVDAARTPEQRTATLAALRDHLASLPAGGERDRVSEKALRLLIHNAARDGFESGTRWIESAGFTTKELADLGDSGALYGINRSDTGKWVEWLGKNTPEEGEKGISRLITDWTRNDYQAAGKWLAGAPEGRTKELSIRSYAETVSRYEPESAVQWADTLPPGKGKDTTLKRIYRNWPKNDDASRAAAEAFAKSRGIR
ncbi:MAG: hypothetical protein EOP85_11360 [Verrucomicrobiaceae bacterium]|nr:MAG: hypothetical protein EOP85_11360 [Verrucomicrobiaceae bacterium]